MKSLSACHDVHFLCGIYHEPSHSPAWSPASIGLVHSIKWGILNCAPSPAFVFLAAACCRLEWCDGLGALSCARRLARERKGAHGKWLFCDSKAPRPPEHLWGQLSSVCCCRFLGKEDDMGCTIGPISSKS